jgi:hypothetical protein
MEGVGVGWLSRLRQQTVSSTNGPVEIPLVGQARAVALHESALLASLALSLGAGDADG